MASEVTSNSNHVRLIQAQSVGMPHGWIACFAMYWRRSMKSVSLLLVLEDYGRGYVDPSNP